MEILFRGKRKDNGKWIEGYIVKDDYGDTYILPGTTNYETYADINVEKLDKHKVIPETVGQYTGIEDKNGKKIFEGDVVFLKDRTDKYIVAYNKIFCAFELKGVFSDTQTNFYRDMVVKVIGNCWDNPELLKEVR